MTRPLPPNLPPDIARDTLKFQADLQHRNLSAFSNVPGQALGPVKIGRGGKLVIWMLVLLLVGFFVLFKILLPVLGLSIIWQVLSSGT